MTTYASREHLELLLNKPEQTFTFDRYGNRRFDEANTTMPSSLVNPAITNPTISTSNNRLTSPGYAYDASGNTTADAGGQTYVYDAENKMISASNSSGTLGQYFYDGDGRRVKKIVPGTGETTIFVYDAGGKLIGEYSTIVAAPQDAKVAYLTSDHLGSPRINTDQNGAVIARHDYHPFGEEILTAQRTAGLNYSADPVRKQFTGYERDTETDLDFAQARYYNSNYGRFASVDPLMASADVINPQTFNRYVYVGNNPLNITDPTGEIWGVKNGIVNWYADGDVMAAAGATEYTLLYAFRLDGTGQMVALNPYANAVANVASAAAWLSTEIAWGATAELLAAGAAALAGVPVAVAAIALADALDPKGRWRTGLNLPEPVRDAKGMSKSYWDDFLGALSKAKSNESDPSSVNIEGETTPANPDPEDSKPSTSSSKPPGHDKDWVKLKGSQGYRDPEGNIWKKDMLHRDHWDVSDRKGNKIKEVDFNGKQIWPGGPKNKNKSP